MKWLIFILIFVTSSIFVSATVYLQDLDFESPTYTTGNLAGQDSWYGGGYIDVESDTTCSGSQTIGFDGGWTSTTSTTKRNFTEVTSGIVEVTFMAYWKANGVGGVEHTDFAVYNSSGSMEVRLGHHSTGADNIIRANNNATQSDTSCLYPTTGCNKYRLTIDIDAGTHELYDITGGTSCYTGRALMANSSSIAQLGLSIFKSNDVPMDNLCVADDIETECFYTVNLDTPADEITYSNSDIPYSIPFKFNATGRWNLSENLTAYLLINESLNQTKTFIPPVPIAKPSDNATCLFHLDDEALPLIDEVSGNGLTINQDWDDLNVSGKFGRAIQEGGGSIDNVRNDTGSFCDIGSAFGQDEESSWELWFYPLADLNVTSGDDLFFMSGVEIRAGYHAGTFQMWKTHGGGTQVFNSDQVNVTANEWNHIVFLYDYTGGSYNYEVSFILNGEFIGSEALSSGSTPTQSTSFAFGEVGSVSPYNAFNGRMDELGVYDNILLDYSDGDCTGLDTSSPLVVGWCYTGENNVVSNSMTFDNVNFSTPTSDEDYNWSVNVSQGSNAKVSDEVWDFTLEGSNVVLDIPANASDYSGSVNITFQTNLTGTLWDTLSDAYCDLQIDDVINQSLTVSGDSSNSLFIDFEECTNMTEATGCDYAWTEFGVVDDWQTRTGLPGADGMALRIDNDDFVGADSDWVKLDQDLGENFTITFDWVVANDDYLGTLIFSDNLVSKGGIQFIDIDDSTNGRLHMDDPYWGSSHNQHSTIVTNPVNPVEDTWYVTRIVVLGDNILYYMGANVSDLSLIHNDTQDHLSSTTGAEKRFALSSHSNGIIYIDNINVTNSSSVIGSDPWSNPQNFSEIEFTPTASDVTHNWTVNCTQSILDITASPNWYFTINGTGGGGDTCTSPGAGDWNISCADNCSFSTAQSVPGNVFINGSGELAFTGGNWSMTAGTWNISIPNTCNLVAEDGVFISG